MFPGTLIFHLAMLPFDAAALWFLNRNKNARSTLKAGVAWSIALLGLAVSIGENGFGHMRLAAYGIFIHGVPMLALCGIILRSASRPLFFGLLISAGALSLAGWHSFYVEPYRLEITRYEIMDPGIKAPLSFAIVSDLQTDSIGDFEIGALNEVIRLKPDAVLLTGDYLQVMNQISGEQEARKLNRFLRELPFSAPNGVYAVKGDVDGGEWITLFDRTGIRAFNSTESFSIRNVRFTALSRSDSRNISIQVRRQEPGFHIVFGHSPNFARGNIDADLLIAGHTHGGQVRFPFLGPLYIHSRVPRSWGAGMTDLGGARKLIVSRGIGMERGYAPRMRFLCRPEIVVVHLMPGKN